MSRSLSLALALALAAVPVHARADGTADEADVQFQLGRERFQHRAYHEALAHFLHSNRLVPNRNVLYNIATTCEQLRRYADAYRYYADALEGETNPEAAASVRTALARITPNVAVLSVTTTPPGATLYLQRKDLGSIGQAPRIFALPPGRYKVIAELAGHDPAIAELVALDLGHESKITLNLPRIVGTVHIEAGDAPGAAVRVDDPDATPSCHIPCDLPLPPGSHDLFFTLEGRQPVVRRLSVTGHTTLRVAPSLKVLTGSLAIDTDEREALVVVDGKPRGRTPVEISPLPVGRHSVHVSLRGYMPADREVEVHPDEQARLSLELSPLREVTAVSRHTEHIDEAPSSVSLIDRQELAAFGYPTIAEALRGLRGVALTNDRVYWSAGIRGLGLPNDYGNRLLVMADGQSLNDNVVNSSYIGSDARVDLHDVDRIEVVRGPGSLLYGTGAFSGVVNLVTSPRDEPTSAHVAVGSYDDTVMRARAGFTLNLGHDRGVWASASAAHAAGVSLTVPLKDPSRNPTSSTTTRVDAFDSMGTAGHAFWGPLTLQWFVHQRDQTIPVGAYSTVFDDPRTHFQDTRMMTELRYEPRLSRNLELMARVQANHYAFNATYQYEARANTERYRGTWFGAESRILYTPVKALKLTFGGEAQLHPQASIIGTSTGGTAPATPYLSEEHPYHFAAAYLLADLAALRWLTISGGGRVDVYSTFGAIGIPRGALIVTPRPGTVLKLMGGGAFRAPSIYEQFYNDGEVSQVHSVDAPRGWKLGPEEVHSGELEVSQRFLDRWVALAAAHVSVIDRLIESVPTTGCLPPAAGQSASCTRYTNRTSPLLAIGGDLELRHEWRQGLMLMASYGYQRTQFLAMGTADPRVVNAPEHFASLRGVAPLVRDLASLALRATLEAPRRIRTDSSEVTNTGVVLDAVLSGHVHTLGLQYAMGLYNLADWRGQVPVTQTFQSRTMTQNGRTFLIDLKVTYP